MGDRGDRTCRDRRCNTAAAQTKLVFLRSTPRHGRRHTAAAHDDKAHPRSHDIITPASRVALIRDSMAKDSSQLRSGRESVDASRDLPHDAHHTTALTRAHDRGTGTTGRTRRCARCGSPPSRRPGSALRPSTRAAPTLRTATSTTSRRRPRPCALATVATTSTRRSGGTASPPLRSQPPRIRGTRLQSQPRHALCKRL